MRMATLFLRFVGLGPFFNMPVQHGITLQLCYPKTSSVVKSVNALKVTNCCAAEVDLIHGTDEIMLSSDNDFATFRVNMTEPFDALELAMRSRFDQKNIVYIPVAVVSDPDVAANPARHVFPTESGDGSVEIDFLSSFPLPEPVFEKLSGLGTTSSHDFFGSARNLVFGHRGMGMTFTNFLKYGPDGQPLPINPHIENTIESFNAVLDAGGDGIEFDVVLTKDLVPILYHDFYVALLVETPDGRNFVKVPIHELTFEEIRKTQIYHADVLTAVKTRPDLPPEMFKVPSDVAFPTLRHALQVTNPKLAFNLEVKYPRANVEGEHQCPGYHDRNLVADKIVHELADHAGERPIVISSFDFDTCLVHGSKQGIWPVAALTHGTFKGKPLWADPRTRTIESSSQFAKGSSLWGISAKADNMVDDKRLLSYVRGHVGTAMMIWGELVADGDTAASLMPQDCEHAACIIITDNVRDVVAKCKAGQAVNNHSGDL